MFTANILPSHLSEYPHAFNQYLMCELTGYKGIKENNYLIIKGREDS